MKILNAGLMIDASPNGFQKAMRQVATGGYDELNSGVPDFSHHLVQKAYALQPDIVFLQVQTPGIIQHQAIVSLKQITKVIHWNGDKRHTCPLWMEQLAGDVYCTAFSNMEDVNHLKSRGYKSDFLQIGIDPERFNRWNIHYPTPDVIFMGNNYDTQFPLSAFRLETIERLRATYGERFGCYGFGYPAHLTVGNLNGNQKQESVVYNNAKIGISISHFASERYTSDRLLRMLASGVFTISHKYPGIEQDFVPGEHLETFETFEELQQKIEYYLSHPEERQKIADAGYKLVQENHTFLHMVNNIIKLANNG